VWREIWDDIGAMLSKAMLGDEGIYVEEQLLMAKSMVWIIAPALQNYDPT
jgi:hypothetical protein